MGWNKVHGKLRLKAEIPNLEKQSEIKRVYCVMNQHG